jgi:hypothetical protein
MRFVGCGYMGNFRKNKTVHMKFSTHHITSGAGFNASSATVSVYKSDSTTQTVVGATVENGFDSRAGIGHIAIVLSSDPFYVSEKDYQVVVTSLIGDETVTYMPGTFSINNRMT